MTQDLEKQQEKIRLFFHTYAPYSIIERGSTLASSGNVQELSQVGKKIGGIVVEESGSFYSVQVEFYSQAQLLATCTCSTPEEMREQWCLHAIALLWRAAEIGFLDNLAGFLPSESTYKMNTSSPEEIAEVIRELTTANMHEAHPEINPRIKVLLDLDSDRLGIQLSINGQLQRHTPFQVLRYSSPRTLDNLLLKLIEEEGSWDDHRKLWYICSSSAIETALGILKEYPDIVLVRDRKHVKLEDEALNAKLSVIWTASSAELRMDWILPDESLSPKTGEILGTGPYWTLIDHSVYKLSGTAVRIAGIFPHASTTIISKTQVGPLLEAITSCMELGPFLEIQHPELQPQSKIANPSIILNLEPLQKRFEHFVSSQSVEVQASLSFKYPASPKGKNLVYLPNKKKEAACCAELERLGFVRGQDKQLFIISGDKTLDLIEPSQPPFPSDWKIEGFDLLRSAIRVSKLSMSFALSSAQSSSSAMTPSMTPGSIDWFDCQVNLSQNNANLPISSLFKVQRFESDKWVLLDNGSYAKVPGGSILQLKTLLGLLDPHYKLANAIKSKIPKVQALSISQLAQESYQLKLDKKLQELSQKLADFQGVRPSTPHKKFVGKLRPYQKEGLGWLEFLDEFDLGGILADEMGLGKTIQALAFIQKLKARRLKGAKPSLPCLVVAPTSVVTNWLYEAKRFTPDLKVLLLQGGQRKSLFKQIPESDLVITSYALLRVDQPFLEKVDFYYVILDEAQNIKNFQAATTRAAKSLCAYRRLVMTGTPTENRPMELWSLFDFLMPGYLGTSEFFRSAIEKPIIDQGPNTAITKLLNSKTRPFVLRRVKADVEKDLPPKIETLMHVPMTPTQAQIYAQMLEELRPRIFDAVSRNGIRGASIHILAALLRLRQICNHPNSIKAFRDIPECDSGKFNALKELITEALECNRKILLYSQFRDMLRIIREWIESQGIKYCYLDGTTKSRQDVIDEFNGNPDVKLFLISLKAGGTGLNLTAADTVIIYDPWWNPYVEVQAIDRAHRIGQTKAVSVYRLITENSIEQKIMDLKSKKSRVVDSLINDNAISASDLSMNDIEQIFSPIEVDGVG